MPLCKICKLAVPGDGTQHRARCVVAYIETAEVRRAQLAARVKALRTVGDLMEIDQPDAADYPARVVAAVGAACAGDDWPNLIEIIEEALPAYVHDDGSGDTVNAVERLHAAGDELRRFQRRLADFPTREKLHEIADELTESASAVETSARPAIPASLHEFADGFARQLRSKADRIRAIATAETKADDYLRCTITIACRRSDGMAARVRLREISDKMMATRSPYEDEPYMTVVVETEEQDATR